MSPKTKTQTKQKGNKPKNFYCPKGFFVPSMQTASTVGEGEGGGEDASYKTLLGDRFSRGDRKEKREPRDFFRKIAVTFL